MINQLKNPRRFKFILFNETKFRLINANHFNYPEDSIIKLNHLIYEDYENSFIKLQNFNFNETFKEILPDKTEFTEEDCNPYIAYQQEYNKHFRKVI